MPEIGFSKYTVYQDVFNNYIDDVIKDISVDKYLAKAKEFEKVKGAKQFKYLFDCQAKLLKLIYYKKDLGVLLKQSYQAGDKKSLKKILSKMRKAIACFNDYHQAFKLQFYNENNESTFAFYNLCLGGSYQRLKDCAERLDWYLKGKVDKIDELEKPILPFKGRGSDYRHWINIASVERYF